MKLHFYTGPQCSLCDLAWDELRKVTAFNDLTIETFNIRDDSELYHRYAVRIPVIQRMDSGAEIGWPFTADMLEEFLR
ncbi:glutaredoxin family protein [Alteromonas sp. CYL-A6]|uniref:glutaredoxin family protein n=1 Tax=Alteromonas nitratireducens TaxID=3390813 RepID=UPI0034BEEDEB